jgi:hypothetical protein
MKIKPDLQSLYPKNPRNFLGFFYVLIVFLKLMGILTIIPKIFKEQAIFPINGFPKN